MRSLLCCSGDLIVYERDEKDSRPSLPHSSKKCRKPDISALIKHPVAVIEGDQGKGPLELALSKEKRARAEFIKKQAISADEFWDQQLEDRADFFK